MRRGARRCAGRLLVPQGARGERGALAPLLMLPPFRSFFPEAEEAAASFFSSCRRLRFS